MKRHMHSVKVATGVRTGIHLARCLPQRCSAWAYPPAAALPCRDPLPQLLTAGKPICAATIRVGLGYLEVSTVIETLMVIRV